MTAVEISNLTTETLCAQTILKDRWRKPKVTFASKRWIAKMRFDRDVVSREDALECATRQLCQCRLYLMMCEMREIMTADRKRRGWPRHRRHTNETESPPRSSVALSLFFSLHPPSFITTLLLLTLLFATPDRLTSAWAHHHLPSAMGIEGILEFHVEYDPIEFFGLTLGRRMDSPFRYWY